MQAPKLMQTLKSLALALLLVSGVSYAASTWSGPWTDIPGTPGSKNVDAPINVGPLSQSKLGDFIVQGLPPANQGVISAPIFTGTYGTFKLVGVGTQNFPNALKVNVNGDVGANHYCDQNGNNCVAPGSLGGGGNTSVTTLPGNPRYASFLSTVLVTYHTWGNRAGSNGLSTPDTIQNYVYVPTNNVLQVGKKYAYLLVTSGDSMGQRELALPQTVGMSGSSGLDASIILAGGRARGGRTGGGGTPSPSPSPAPGPSRTFIPSRCYNSGHDPISDPFIFSDIDGTGHGNAVFSHQGTFVYNPTTITSADGRTAQGVLIAKNTTNCSDPGKGDARIYVYEVGTLQGIMAALYNETPTSVRYPGQVYGYGPANSAYLFRDQP